MEDCQTKKAETSDKKRAEELTKERKGRDEAGCPEMEEVRNERKRTGPKRSKNKVKYPMGKRA